MSKDFLSSQARKAHFTRFFFNFYKTSVPKEQVALSLSWPPRQDSRVRFIPPIRKEQNKNLPKVTFKSEETSLGIVENTFEG